MLHVPVALITEKLRGQSLDDDHVKVPREGALQIEGKNVWMSCDGDSKDQEGNTTTTTTPTSRGEKGGTPPGATSLPFLPPLNDNDRPGMGPLQFSPQGGFLQSPSSGGHRFPVKPVVRFRSSHNHNEQRADYTMRAFETPPKKKHCRSLSMPADTPPQGAGVGVCVASTSPLVEGARVWRPIPITALITGGGGGGGSLLAQSDSSRTMGVGPPHFTTLHSHHYHHHHDHPGRTLGGFTTIGGGGSTTARLQRDLRGVGVSGGVAGGGGGGSTTPPFPMAPPSPLSVDSGRDTTTSSSDPHTPPQSPIPVPPRPSSATSVRSGLGQAFISSACWGGSSSRAYLRGEVLQSRSLSCEEHMSTTPDLQPSSSGSTPCVLGGGGAGSAGGCGPSPLSPCRGGKIPRCHSQPCVLHHRRCGKKRRRDDRPTLDFHKMTETAYFGKHVSSITPAQDIQKGRWRGDMDYMRVGGLMPIASSPRDTDLPATPRATDHAALSTICDLDTAASPHLPPSTPPVSDVSSGIDIREPVKLLGEEEEEEEEELEDQEGDSNCDCHRDTRRDDSAGLFPLTDLDLEQIENH